MVDDHRRLSSLEYLYNHTTKFAWENYEALKPYVSEKCSVNGHGSWNFQTQTILRLHKWLAPLLPYGILYGNDSNPLFWNFQNFFPSPTFDMEQMMDMSYLHKLRGIEIQLRGIYLEKDGIYFCAYPNDDTDYMNVCLSYLYCVNKCQSSGIDLQYYDSKYPFLKIPIFHFTSVPPQDTLSSIEKKISRWSEAYFGTFLPTYWTMDVQGEMPKKLYLPNIIAHRGLLTGPDTVLENTLEQLRKNFQNQIISEVDIWYQEDTFYLGHDSPTYKISLDWILQNKKYILIHAKNVEAFAIFQKLQSRDGIDLHYFFHTSENVVFTSRGYIIPYVGEDVYDGWIYMMPERTECKKMKNAVGPGMFCSDYKDILQMF
jgi:hypothetical protein